MRYQSLISNTKTQISIAYQTLDLYRIPKPRFVINLVFGIQGKSRFRYIVYIWVLVCDINLGFGVRYQSRFCYTV
jgi:hypothetical protein